MVPSFPGKALTGKYYYQKIFLGVIIISGYVNEGNGFLREVGWGRKKPECNSALLHSGPQFLEKGVFFGVDTSAGNLKA
jgi:hypothetical protein